MSPRFIEKYGKLADDLRLCTSVDYNMTSPADLWIDEVWRETDIRYLDIERYNDWIAPQKVGDKPWLVIFGITPYGSHTSQQTTNLMMVKIMCLAKMHGEDYNYGFADFKKGEMILESYDYSMQYGTMAPYLLFFKDGKAHHLASKNWNPKEITTFMTNYTMESRWTEPIRPARNSLSIFIEYASREVANDRQVHKVY